MRLAVRPSKTFLWSLLDRDLSQLTDGIGLDAASAAFKSYPYFKTKQYFGLDISFDALKSGTALCPNAVGLNGSLTEFDLPSNSVDLVVSTNTLCHLDFEQRAIAIEKLSQLVNKKGCFLVEIDNDAFFQKAIHILEKYFSDIKITYYQNFISYKYESIWEKEGFLGDHPIAGSKPFLSLSFLLSKFESLTCKKSGTNKHAYIKCTGKIQDERDNTFDILDKKQIGDRIYEV